MIDNFKCRYWDTGYLLVVTLKYIVAMIRPEKFNVVKKELQKVEINGLTVSAVSGYGVQKGHLEIDRIKAKKYEANLLEKIKIEVAVNDDFLQMTVEAIQNGSRDKDGYVGSGKIFVMSLEDAIRVRTNESGPHAI
jgi:nitrogen regulatory protein P-II 2